MRITCPCCGALHELDTLVQHEYARRAVAAAAQLPPALFAACMRYLRLFVSVSSPQRALTADRAATLLDALVQAINAGKVDAKGRDWSAPLSAWPQAFDAVFERADSGALKRPLKSHAYLFGVISNLTNAEEAKAEAATEVRRMGGRAHAQPAAFASEPYSRGAVLVKMETSTFVQNAPESLPTLDRSKKPSREIPAFAEQMMAKLSARKSFAAASAQPAEANVAAPAPDPLLGTLAAVAKGRWKGKGGTIVRVVGEQIYVAIQFPHNGLQTIPFNRSELSL
jgi:hypothetical protein